VSTNLDMDVLPMRTYACKQMERLQDGLAKAVSIREK
jgi:hypothetical protein